MTERQAAAQRLFSYGSLRDENVQRDVFGRPLAGVPDVLTGYRLRATKISDERTIRLTGNDIQQILERTADRNDAVDGTVFDISEKELLLADEYEPAGYRRVQVRLRSGVEAWVYVEA